MQAGAPVRIVSVDDDDSSLHGRTGVVRHRIVNEDRHLERNRYLVDLDADDTADDGGSTSSSVNETPVKVDLENLLCTDSDGFFDDADDEDEMMIVANGLCFCAAHRLEICGQCGFNFCNQNLVSEMPREFEFYKAYEMAPQCTRKDCPFGRDRDLENS